MNDSTAIARYPSRCELCDQTIEEGERIALYEDEWCHYDCVVEETGQDPDG